MARVVGLALLIGLVVAGSASAQVSVDMRADHQQISINENAVVRIEVRSQGPESAQVQLPEFEGFEVVQRQVNRPMQFSFGFGTQTQIKTTTQYTFVLRPLSPGRHVIQPVKVRLGNQVYQGRPVNIDVVGAPNSPQPNRSTTPDPQAPSASPPAGNLDGAEFDDYAFLRTVADKSNPFEREQVTVTVYLYIRDQLRSAPHVETEPSTDGFWTRDLLPTNRTLSARRQSVNGVLYAVYVVRRFAAFPLRSGSLTIGPMSVKLDQTSLFDMFRANQQRREIERTGVPLAVEVRPLPEDDRPDGDVAVGRFTMAAKLDRTQAITGDAVTLTASVRGTGHVRSVTIPNPVVDGLEVLQPQTQDLVEAPDDLVTGTRTFEWLIVPQRPGTFTIPPLVVNTFDPTTERYTRVATEALSLVAAGTAVTAQPAQPAEEPEPEVAIPLADHTWAPIRTVSRLERRHAHLLQARWYPWAVSFMPLLWLAVIGGSRVRRDLARRHTVEGPQKLRREARQRLGQAQAGAGRGDPASFYSEATAALQLILESRVEEAVGSLTHDELKQRLDAWGMDAELAGRLLSLLKDADFARFSSLEVSAQELDSRLSELRAVFAAIEAFEPGEAQA